MQNLWISKANHQKLESSSIKYQKKKFIAKINALMKLHQMNFSMPSRNFQINSVEYLQSLLQPERLHVNSNMFTSHRF